MAGKTGFCCNARLLRRSAPRNDTLRARPLRGIHPVGAPHNRRAVVVQALPVARNSFRGHNSALVGAFTPAFLLCEQNI